jgi:hypothetical protein
MAPVRTVVTFRSTVFNTTEEKDSFINPGCFGDDVAKWLMEKLRGRDVHTADEPDSEDFGWYFTFRYSDIEYDFVISYRPGEGEIEGDWIGWLERRRGLLASVFGLRKKGIQPEAAQALHEVLSASADIRDVRWHFQKDFDADREEDGAPTPSG